MSRPPKNPPSRPYEVGYGKPPPNRRFKKGVSGNPAGRPRGITPGRAMRLALKEIFRPVKIREGDRVTELSGFQVVMRQLMAQAAKGNGPSGRMLIEKTFELEQDLKTIETIDAGSSPHAAESLTTADRARALAAFISKVNSTKAGR
jgi:hypothetical protein